MYIYVLIFAYIYIYYIYILYIYITYITNIQYISTNTKYEYKNELSLLYTKKTEL